VRRQRLHQLPQASNGFIGRQEQVNVIRHQAIGVDLDPKDIFQLSQIANVTLIVLLSSKHYLPIMTTLHYMMRVVRQHDPSHPWHNYLLPLRPSLQLNQSG